MKYLFPVEGTVLRAVDKEASSLIAGVAAVGAFLISTFIAFVDVFAEPKLFFVFKVKVNVPLKFEFL